MKPNRFSKKRPTIAPQNADAHNLLGIVFGELGKSADAEREYKTAIRLNPKAVPPRANLGVLLAKNKRQNEAITAFETVLKLNPNHASNDCQSRTYFTSQRVICHVPSSFCKKQIKFSRTITKFYLNSARHFIKLRNLKMRKMPLLLPV